MTDRDALLRAICDNPADDTVRLVFADWLDENPDAVPASGAAAKWAAFIRCDIAMSRFDEYDLARLRWELIEKPRHEAEPWAREVLAPELRTNPPAGEPLFRRGFPWFVPLMPAAFFATADRVLTGVPAATLACRGTDSYAEAVFRSPHLARLTGLRVDLGNLSARAAQSLVESRHATNLEELHAGNRGFGPAAVQALLRSDLFQQLVRLRLDNQPGLGRAADDFGRAAVPARLIDLNLASSGLTFQLAEAVLAAPAVRGVERLSLAGCPLYGGGHEAVAGADLPFLRALDLTQTWPRAEGFRALSTSPILARLERLWYGRNSISGPLVAEFANCREAGNLRALDLTSNAIGNDGAAAIARSPHLSGLRVLVLQHCMVGDDGVEALLESPLADGLALLDLRGSPASAEMKEVLKARMGDRVRV